MQGFGTSEFELVLLRRMADYQPELVEETLRRIGSSRAELRCAHARWQGMLRARRFPPGLAGRRLVLGRPEASVPRPVGALTLVAHRWSLPLWPELRFEVVASPDGWIAQEWLVRADGSRLPQFTYVDDLTPWSAVVGDLGASFPDATHAEGDAPSRWVVEFGGPAADGSAGRYRAHFVWGLLQHVDQLSTGSVAEALAVGEQT
jgi:hypothetical protein